MIFFHISGKFTLHGVKENVSNQPAFTYSKLTIEAPE